MSKNRNFRKSKPKAELKGEDVRREMQMVIDAAYCNTEPKAKEMFQSLFGDKKPTVEEFIETVAKEVHRRTDS